MDLQNQKWDGILSAAMLLYAITMFVSGFINPLLFYLMPLAIAIFAAASYMIIKHFIPIAIAIFAISSYAFIWTMIYFVKLLLMGDKGAYLYLYSIICFFAVWFITAVFVNNCIIYKAISKTEGFPMYLEFLDESTRIKRAVRSSTKRLIREKQREIEEYETIDIDMTDIELK